MICQLFFCFPGSASGRCLREVLPADFEEFLFCPFIFLGIIVWLQWPADPELMRQILARRFELLTEALNVDARTWLFLQLI